MVLSLSMVLQICYAPALRDATARRTFFSNAQALVRECRGKNVVLSSNCRSTIELR